MPPKAPASTQPAVTKVKDDFHKMVGDVDIVLPSLSYLKPGLVRRIRRMGDVDAMYTLFEIALSEEQLAVVDEMDPDEYETLLDEWRAHSGVSLGESSASTS
ncbi:hypothetical protein GV792_04650 [Nocardia cyriacigeorgica]|uniref:hypothetical protein n=1 Tax=Nocardia cyriacigeorgica TaxID=135487 RepID=UPI0013BD3F86|nr:hypothetical protein [Nocardia cyriacigeorgica]NEW49332.1 hypothetical protein [Nocardia cyriacigeorgica]